MGATTIENARFAAAIAAAIAKEDGIDLTPQMRTEWVARYRLGPIMRTLIQTPDPVLFKRILDRFTLQHPGVSVSLFKIEEFK